MNLTKTITALCAVCASLHTYAQDASAYQWPDSIYACVNNADYLTQEEKQVVIEINKARTNPVQYALEVLVPYMHSINYDNVYTDSQGYLIRTQEGQGAVDEAIDAMHLQKPVPMMHPQQYLALAAADLCNDIGPKGMTGHIGTDGSSLKQRIAKHNSEAQNAGCSEISSYGNMTPVEIVRSLIVDDGIQSRPNRKMLFENYSSIGIAIGTHTKYDKMSVLVFQNTVTKDNSDNHTPVITATHQNTTPVPDITAWPDSIYAAVANATYLSQLEKDAVIEVNKARTNPTRYIQEVLTPYLEAMGNDSTYLNSEGKIIQTFEGKSAIVEAIEDLKKIKPGNMLRPKQSLYLSALDHCKDCGPKGIIGHEGSDGSTPYTRIKKYDPNACLCGENIAYGIPTAMEIVRSLIVDDNVKDRGHRKNTFLNYGHIGVASGMHTEYKLMIVFNFS